MDMLKDQVARYKFDMKEAEKEIEKRELQLIALLSQMDVNEMQHGIYNFSPTEYRDCLSACHPLFQ